MKKSIYKDVPVNRVQFFSANQESGYFTFSTWKGVKVILILGDDWLGVNMPTQFRVKLSTRKQHVGSTSTTLN